EGAGALVVEDVVEVLGHPLVDAFGHVGRALDPAHEHRAFVDRGHGSSNWVVVAAVCRRSRMARTTSSGKRVPTIARAATLSGGSVAQTSSISARSAAVSSHRSAPATA